MSCHVSGLSRGGTQQSTCHRVGDVPWVFIVSSSTVLPGSRMSRQSTGGQRQYTLAENDILETGRDLFKESNISLNAITVKEHPVFYSTSLYTCYSGGIINLSVGD